MRKFVLETTQQCNFRCKYCFNTIETVFRHHTNKQMTLPVAKAAIDFYKKMYGCEISEEEMLVMREAAKEAGVIDETD